MSLKLLKKEEQVKNKLSMEYWNRIVYAFAIDREWQGLTIEKLMKFCLKSKLSIYLNFF